MGDTLYELLMGDLLTYTILMANLASVYFLSVFYGAYFMQGIGRSARGVR